MHSRRNQSGCIECVLGQVCMSYLKTALIFKVTALYSSFLTGLGLNTSSLEPIMVTCPSVREVINKSSDASWSQWPGSHILCRTVSGDAAIFPSLSRGRRAAFLWWSHCHQTSCCYCCPQRCFLWRPMLVGGQAPMALRWCCRKPLADTWGWLIGLMLAGLRR